MGLFQIMLNKLTDVFLKREDSNMGNLILILSEQMDDVNDTLIKTELWRNIDSAEGTTLDLIGANVGQKRGGVTDEIMRVLIKAKVARNYSDGTFNKIINAIAISLNTSPKTVKIKAMYSQGEPAAIMVEGVPLEALNNTGMTVSQLGIIVQQTVSAGVRVASIDLSGTFSFSSQSNILETSVEFGLAPVDQSTGGTLGASFTPDQETELPI